MPRGHKHDLLYSLSIRNMVFHFKFLGEKGGHYYIQTRHTDLLCPLQSYSKPRKARVNTKRIYRNVLMPPGHPIILLKSN